MSVSVSSVVAAVLVITMRAHGTAAIEPWDAELQMLPKDVVAEHGAACLDGSTPGYYFRAATTARYVRSLVSIPSLHHALSRTNSHALNLGQH